MNILSNNTQKISKDQLFGFLVIVAVCQFTLFDYIRVIISKLPLLSFTSSLFFPILYTLLIILSFTNDRIKWVRTTDIFLLFFFMLAILFTYVIYPINAKFISQRFMVSIFPCFPFFLLGLCIDMDDALLKKLGIFSVLAIIISIVYLFYYKLTNRQLSEDEMGRAYALLPNVMIVTMCSCKKFGKLFTIWSIIGMFYILSMGTRGPIVILVVYLLVNLYKYSRIKKKQKILVTIFAFLFVILFIQTQVYTQMLRSLIRVFSNMGVSTRIFEYVLYGDMISNTSGRDDIYLELLKLLMKRPLLGYGVYGEWQFVNYSAHNIYLETIFQYGIFIGSIMLISYILTVLNAYKKAHSEAARDWILLWSTFTFIRGIFGGELLSFYVFFLLGFSLKEIRKSKICLGGWKRK